MSTDDQGELRAASDLCEAHGLDLAGGNLPAADADDYVRRRLAEVLDLDRLARDYGLTPDEARARFTARVGFGGRVKCPAGRT